MAVVGLALAISAFAHGVGQSLEQVVGEYLVDIGYSAFELTSGETVRFDFDVLDNNTREPVPFTDIWVRVSEGHKTVFAGGIMRARLGATGMSMVFPSAGEYELRVRYQNNDTTVVEAAFPLIVVQGRDNAPRGNAWQFLIGGLGGLAAGLGAAMVFRRRIAP